MIVHQTHKASHIQKRTGAQPPSETLELYASPVLDSAHGILDDTQPFAHALQLLRGTLQADFDLAEQQPAKEPHVLLIIVLNQRLRDRRGG